MKETLSGTMAPGFARHSKGPIILFLLLFLMIPTLLFFAVHAGAAQVTLGWTASSSPNVTGYDLYYSTTSGSLGSGVNVGNVTSYTVTGLSAGATYYFAVAAHDGSGDESGDSNEVSYTVPTGTCTYSLSSSGATVSASGGTGSVTVTTQSGCSWTASSGASWMTVAPASGSGSGPVTYSVTTPNTSTSTRAAVSTIAGLVFTVTQAAAAPPKTQTYTITASAGTGGSISPSGSVTVNSGSSKTFGITPKSGYITSGVTVDGKSMGRLTSYTFNNVTANHTIRVTFRSRWWR